MEINIFSAKFYNVNDKRLQHRKKVYTILELLNVWIYQF